MLELVAVIAIIATLFAVAFGRLWALQVEAERTAIEQVAGALRSAIGIKVAEHYVNGDFTGVRSLEGSNPMDRLAEVPHNYLGALSGVDPATVPPGHWYFDVPSRTLVYRVKNADYFRSDLGAPARIRFTLRVLYGQSVIGPAGSQPPPIEGAQLAAVEPYAWIDAGHERWVH
jgi:general secretion pathway protein G